MPTLSIKPVTAKPARSERCVSVRARGSGRIGDIGGGMGGEDNSRRLILPGQGGGAPSAPGRIILPGSGPGGDGKFRPGGSGLGLEIPDSPPQVRNFRPPPGFMDSLPGQEADIGLSVDEMLNKIRTNAAYWHDLAKLLPHLARQGYPAEMVEEATGTERKMQSIWVSALQVYESLGKAEGLDPATLAYYDMADGADLLYELRFLSAAQRAAAAQFIKDQGFNQAETLILARSIKEHERRKGTKEGFSNSPADCLAYKYYRDALETRRQEDVEKYATKGLSVADTDGAKAALNKLFEGNVIQSIGPSSILTVLRMTRDEVGFRPIVVAGTFQDITPAQLRAVPKVSSEGVFGNFRIPAEGLDREWVALPAWSIITLAVTPVILSIVDCNEAKGIREALFAKSKEDDRKVKGPGLLVADVAMNKEEPISIGDYYLVEGGDGKVSLKAGSEGLDEAAVLGKVLFLCRPPSRDSDAASTSELLQM